MVRIIPLVRTNRNERTTSKRTLQFSVGISEKWITIYLPSGISEIFCQMVSTAVVDTIVTMNVDKNNCSRLNCRTNPATSIETA